MNLMIKGSTSFSSLTLGCKLNQYDTAAIENGLITKGWNRVSSLAKSQVLIINTCIVTDNSQREAKKLIRSMRKKYPDIFLIVTGCLVESNFKAETKDELNEVDLFFGNVLKYSSDKIINSFNKKQNKGNNKFIENSQTGIKSNKKKVSNIMDEKIAEFYPVNVFFRNRSDNTNSRAFVKIQDGCSLRCSYCIIPYVRGKNRSVTANIILPYLTTLEKKGFREAVLTGIHIGTYGQDFFSQNSKPRCPDSLLDLLKIIEISENPIKIRLSSLDCNEISDELIKFIGYSKKIQPHLHIPLQSGSDNILKKMKRKYSKEQFLDTINKLSLINPDIMLGTDIIVGFPGETETDFKETRDLFQNSSLSYAHIFPFSPRGKTPAANMPDQLSHDIIQSRRKKLQSLSNEKRQNFYQSQIGKTRNAIILQKGLKPRVLTDNYLDLCLDNSKKELKPRALIQVKIKINRNSNSPIATLANSF